MGFAVTARYCLGVSPAGVYNLFKGLPWFGAGCAGGNGDAQRCSVKALGLLRVSRVRVGVRWLCGVDEGQGVARLVSDDMMTSE